jgi:glycosyltransferase involved in cell wall biosynthesis
MRRFDRQRRAYIRAIARQGPVEVGYAFFRARRRNRNRADDEGLSESDELALSDQFDILPGDLEANAAVIRAYDEAEAPEIRSIQWFLPWFHHAYFAGNYTILRVADHLARVHGVENRFCIYDASKPDAWQGIQAKIAAAFPTLSTAVVDQCRRPWSADGQAGDPFGHLPEADAAVATFWTSAYPVLRFNRCRAKFLFVQDFEPAFYAAGSAWALAEETWSFGFPGIVNTPGLADVYRSYGNRAVSFVPAVDTERYTPPTGPRDPARPARVFFYGRPTQARNAFGLGLAALKKVKERLGDRVEIVSAGADWHPGAYGVQGVVENLGVLPDLDAVADLYRSCDVGLVFMLTKHPSYQPFEFMASGTVCVSNRNPATAWLLRHEDNALIAPPAPTLVAAEVVRAVEDGALRERLVARGLETVRAVSWEEQLEGIWAAMSKRGSAFT